MSKIQVMAHTSFLGHTGYNNHSRNFFTHLNKYIPTKVRNYSYCDDLSYLKPEEMSVIMESKWNDPPYKIGSSFVRDPEATLVNIVLNESHHYYFYDNYDGIKIAYNVWESTRQPEDYFNRLLEFDYLWVPTEWQRQCSIDQGYPSHRVFVIPEAVNGNIFFPEEERSLDEYKDGRFKFILFGRWDYRKSTTEIIKTFLKTLQISPSEQ